MLSGSWTGVIMLLCIRLSAVQWLVGKLAESLQSKCQHISPYAVPLTQGEWRTFLRMRRKADTLQVIAHGYVDSKHRYILDKSKVNLIMQALQSFQMWHDIYISRVADYEMCGVDNYPSRDYITSIRELAGNYPIN